MMSFKCMIRLNIIYMRKIETMGINKILYFVWTQLNFWLFKKSKDIEITITEYPYLMIHVIY